MVIEKVADILTFEDLGDKTYNLVIEGHLEVGDKVKGQIDKKTYEVVEADMNSFIKRAKVKEIIDV